MMWPRLTKPFREDILLEAIGNATLTSREREVMERITISISLITVKAHRGSMMRKMAAVSLARDYEKAVGEAAVG